MRKLRFLRVTRELNQSLVGAATSIHQSKISAYETGRMQPSPAQLLRLANFFNVPAEELLEEVNSSESAS